MSSEHVDVLGRCKRESTSQFLSWVTSSSDWLFLHGGFLVLDHVAFFLMVSNELVLNWPILWFQYSLNWCKAPTKRSQHASRQHITTLLGATCCVRLSIVLRCVATCWVLLAQTRPFSNLSQQHPTGCNTSQHGARPNDRNYDWGTFGVLETGRWGEEVPYERCSQPEVGLYYWLWTELFQSNWQVLFLFLVRDGVGVHKHAKIERRHYQAILTEQACSIKDVLWGFHRFTRIFLAGHNG